MWPSKAFVQQINHWMTKSAKLSYELHLVVALVTAGLLTIIFKLIGYFDGVPSVFEHLVVLLILLLGVAQGPLVAALAGLVCGIILSPLGETDLDKFIHGEELFWWVRVISFITAGFVGGVLRLAILQHVEQKYRAERTFEGTQLPNFQAALEHLEQVVKGAPNHPPKELNLVNLRLNNYDKIRQELGRDDTNQLIRDIASQLKTRLGENAYVTQTANNELVGFHSPLTKSALGKVQQDISAMLEELAAARGQRHRVEASAGLHEVKQPTAKETELSGLLESLSVTTQKAAESKQPVVIMDADLVDDDVDDIGAFSVKRQLQLALTKKEFTLYYEPRLNTANGFFSSIQAITVWNNPKRGELWPADFLPMMEEAAMVRYFTLWMLRSALHDAQIWHRKGYKFRMSLNIIFSDKLADKLDSSVLSFLLNEIKSSSVPSMMFSLEVSEKALMNADKKSINYLTHLQHQGLTIIVVGFGEGAATLQTLFRLPVDAVKFAAERVRKAVHHSDQKRELYSLIKMIRSKGLTTIAEGVETREALLMLKQLGCDELQGPILSKPLKRTSIPWTRIRA